MYIEVKRPILSVLYILALLFSVPLSFLVWYVRRELVKETDVAGGTEIGCLKQESKTTIDGGESRLTKRNTSSQINNFEIRIDH
ncbi:hypothetical protein WR25_22486 [Diploscapter pachys]|uniref:Uncharacterized protein n=1 Tax=Diploscapter pachys TaxID=2018661 RepID=A0A2A2JHL2_9BILA|nr:hypothetical protein WR25_22486 [Diploscapter pachys]